MERLPVSLSPIDRLKRLAREKQAELARCDDPPRRVLLLQERNALLAKAHAMANGDVGQEPRRAPPQGECDDA